MRAQRCSHPVTWFFALSSATSFCQSLVFDETPEISVIFVRYSHTGYDFTTASGRKLLRTKLSKMPPPTALQEISTRMTKFYTLL